MYESFYNLKVEPFRLSPDHRFCFSHKSYAKAKAYMQYAIHRAEGFVMVTGKPGTGKTTLVNDLVDGLSHSQIVVATIVSTQLEADDLLRLVAYNFGLEVDAPNKAVLLQGLSVRLRRYHEEGTRALLIIDEAQDLSASALEELRLLTNLQLNNQPLLQIFLVGQENLRDLVQKPSMEQVHQRLVAACHLEALNEADTEAYIKHRLDRVGWKNDPQIDQGVYPLVYQFSKGVPRRINLVCSRFLLHGCVEEKHRIRVADVRTVVEELQHEQLAPVGFKADLPPLPQDEEPLEPDSDMEPDVNEEQPAAMAAQEELSVKAVDTGKSNPSVQEAPVATKTPAAAPIKPLDGVADLSSLENQKRQDAVTSSPVPDDVEEDVIQENYFSLSEAVDLPSEPVPIKKPAEPRVKPRGGYGDRFASVKLNEPASANKTHYYNQYRSDSRSSGAGSRKWSRLSVALLILIAAFTIAAAVYLLGPQLLDERVSKNDQEPNQPAAVVNGHQAADQSVSQPAGTETGNGDAESAQPVTPEEVARADVASATSELKQQETRSSIDPVTQTLLNSETVLTEKKTAPEVELSDVSPLTDRDDVEEALTRVSLAVDQSVDSGKIALASQTFAAKNQKQNAAVEEIVTASLSSGAVSAAGDRGAEAPLPDTTHTLPHDASPESAIEPDMQSKVFFRSDSTFIQDEYKEQLSQLAAWLQRHQGSVVRIVGYADSLGDAAYNQALSLKRAQAVAAYLESKNVDDSRFRIEGRGSYSNTDSLAGTVGGERRSQRLVEVTAGPLTD